MTDTKFTLPDFVGELVEARNKLRDHYVDVDLPFTFDGNLVGDLGEAVAAELFGLTLTGRGNKGIDGHTADGKSVQIKASGTKRGAAFRPIDKNAEYLVVLQFDYDTCIGTIIYNGPEEPVVSSFPETWKKQRMVSAYRLRKLNEAVDEKDRLPLKASRTAE